MKKLFNFTLIELLVVTSMLTTINSIADCFAFVKCFYKKKFKNFYIFDLIFIITIVN